MRRGSGPTISLFSFQDIITSVMGILIFVALMLALRLVHATGRIVEALEQSGPRAEEIRQLEEKKAELIEEHCRLKEKMQALEVSPDEVAALRRQVQELENRLAELEKQTENLFGGFNEKMRAAVDEIASLKQRNEQLEQQLASVDAQLQRLGKMKDLTFNVSGFEGFNRYVLDLHKDGWRLSQLSATGEARTIAVWQGPLAARESQALHWCKQRGSADYVFILVRPSAIDSSRKILEQLRSRNIARGFEPLGEDQQFHLASES